MRRGEANIAELPHYYGSMIPNALSVPLDETVPTCFSQRSA